MRETKYKCPKGCGKNLTEVEINGIIYGFYCLACDKEYLLAGYTPRPEEKEDKK